MDQLGNGPNLDDEGGEKVSWFGDVESSKIAIIWKLGASQV